MLVRAWGSGAKHSARRQGFGQTLELKEAFRVGAARKSRCRKVGHFSRLPGSFVNLAADLEEAKVFEESAVLGDIPGDASNQACPHQVLTLGDRVGDRNVIRQIEAEGRGRLFTYERVVVDLGVAK